MGRKGESIFKRKDGRYEARYIKAYNGDLAVYGYLFGKSYTDVKYKRRKIITEKERKITINRNKFSLYVLRWLEYKKDKVKLSTYATYVSKIKKHIMPELGEYKLSSLDKQTIESYLNTKLIFLETNTVHELGMLLKQIVKYNHLMLDFDIPIKKKKNIDVFQKNEITRLENNTLISDNPICLGIALSLFTGIRIGELCALKKENFDLNNCLIYINHTLIRVKSDNQYNRR